MGLFALLLSLLQLVHVLHCEPLCKSTFLRVLPGYRLRGTPKVELIVESAVICAIRCVDEEYCKCCSIINHGRELNCMLYDVDCNNPDNIVKDKSAIVYAVMDDKDGGNTSIVSPSKSVETVTSSETTSFLVTTSPTEFGMTSSSAILTPDASSIISPSLPVLSPSTTSIAQNNLPPVACQEIFEKDKSSPDGTYRIFEGTSNDANVFCDMTGALAGCGGGGWTLVMRINGQRDSFKYSSFRWKEKSNYYPHYGKILFSNEETKLSTYWSTRFTKICLGMSYNDKLGWTIIEMKSSSLFDLIASGVYHNTSLAVSNWKGLIDGDTSLQEKCPIQGINVVRGDTGARIGIIATKTCHVDRDYNSRLGFGTKGSSCGQVGTNSCGNEARCDAKPRDLSTKTFGYILVK